MGMRMQMQEQVWVKDRKFAYILCTFPIGNARIASAPLRMQTSHSHSHLHLYSQGKGLQIQ